MSFRNLIFVCLLLCGFSVQAQRVFYVKEGAHGQGSSWSDAAGSLQSIINKATAGDQIYVAKGRYYAYTDGDMVTDERGVGTSNRFKSFVMKSGVKVYGGFAGTDMAETPETRVKVQDARYGWQLRDSSVLTGANPNGTKDEWTFDTRTQSWTPSGYPLDNAIHVVWFASAGFGSLVAGEATEALSLGAETVLDGFVIEGGSADGNASDGGIQGHSARFGGGVYLVENGVLRNCIVRENYAQTRGGGVFMNNGGLVSDCYIERNASPGAGSRNGFGGGLYVLGQGKMERSFVVNNSARMGGGIYTAKYKQPLPYRILIETSVVANNAAAHEAGGIYCDAAGVFTGLVIARNYTLSGGGDGNGNTGGLYCNSYAVVTNTVLWNNSASAASRQFYLTNVISATADQPASVQFYGCAIQNVVEQDFDHAGKSLLTNIDDGNFVYQPQFKLDPGEAGLLDTRSYLSEANWDKEECSVLLKNGVVDLDAPLLTKGERVVVPTKMIDGQLIVSRPDIGPYVNEGKKVNASYNEQVGAWVVYVDREVKVCGDGSSWASPTKLPRMAIDHLLAEHGGGQVWIKEGVYLPLAAGFGNVNSKDYYLEMKNGVDVYGGFPQNLPNPGMSDRNPILYRTILSSDVGIRGDISDNSYHTIMFPETITKPTVLDGIGIMDANGEGEDLTPYGEMLHGGAVVVKTSNAVIRNCFIENNKGVNGAAVWANQPFKMENCVVNNNMVTRVGGAVMELAEGTELMNLTVVMNEGIGIRLPKGKITNTVIWGNTGNSTGNGTFDDVQIDGLPVISYSALNNMLAGNNVYLSQSTTGVNAPNFENPTTIAGIVPYGGYATLLGGPAVFRPNCISALVMKGTNENAPATDITCKKQEGSYDIGAYRNTCLLTGDRIRYVKEGGKGSGLSWNDPMGDVAAAVRNVVKGGEVWVAGGTYTGTFKFKDGVNVYGGFPNFGTPGMKERQPASQDPQYRTILQAQSTEEDTDVGRVLEQSNDFRTPTTWDGFTIQHGSIRMGSASDGGAGVKLMKNGRLENCVIRNNINEFDAARKGKIVEPSGGGVFNMGGELVNCYIRDNKVSGRISDFFGAKMCYVSGAGVYMTSGSMYNCVVFNNTASSIVSIWVGSVESRVNGAGVYVGSGSFYNNTIVYNKAITEATALGNPVESSASGIYVGSSTIETTITNCIIWGNSGTQKQITGGTTKVTYSCVQDGTTDGGNTTADPLFADAANDNFRLKDSSPVINVGNTYPQGIKLPATDMDYTRRVKDCAVDMGAYEHGHEERIELALRGDSAIVYVTRDGAGKADGSSWANAACGEKLQKAINVVATSSKKVKQVWVGVGATLYDPNLESTWSADFYPTEQLDPLLGRSSIFRIKSGVIVIGGFRGDEKNPDERKLEAHSSPVTILNGDILRTPDNNKDDAYHVAVVEGSARLENFLVVNGQANHFSDKMYQNGGGLVIRKNGVVRNCYIYHCYASMFGGGVYMEEGAKLTGSIIMKCESSLGAGVYMEARTELTTSTVVRNSAGYMGGGVSFEHPVAIQGCVLWGNEATNNKDIAGDTDLPYEPEATSGILSEFIYPINFSAIENVRAAGTGNVELASTNDAEGGPRFVDPTNINGGWKLQPNSPLVDKGMKVLTENEVSGLLQSLDLGKWDMAGKARIKTVFSGNTGFVMDMGAYESDKEIVLNPATVDGKKRLYVTYTSRGNMDGSSWENGISDLQSALNYFQTNGKGEIWVQGGYSYIPTRFIDPNIRDARTMSFILNRNTDIYGGFKGDETSLEQRELYDRNENGVIENFEFRHQSILDGMATPVGGSRNVYHVVYYDDLTATTPIIFDGLTVSNGSAIDNGGGLYAKSPMKLVNCVFRHNSAKGAGGALWYRGTSATPFVIQQSSFGGNSSEGRGGAISMNNGLILNSYIFNNTSVQGGGLDVENTTLLNIVVARNEAATAAGVLMNGSSMTNTVVWGNVGGEEIVASGNSVITYSGVENGEGLTGDDAVTHNIRLNANNNLYDAPRFISPTTTAGIAGYDYLSKWTVHVNSLLVDKGKNEAYLPTYPQVMGYFQYANAERVEIHRIENGTIDIGCHEYKRADLAQNLSRMYVRTWESPYANSDGSSWEKATSDLQGAIEAMENSNQPNKEIWVAAGVYIPTKSSDNSSDVRTRSFIIAKGGVKIYGGFPDDGTGLKPGMSERNTRKYITALSGKRMDNYHVVRINGKAPVLLDGFVIMGGKNAQNDGWEAFGSGALILNEVATINHCIFTENSGGNGAFFMRDKDTKVENSLFYNNDGRAAWMENGHFLNNTVVNNTEGVYIRGGEMKNCVVWGNKGEKQLSDETLDIHPVIAYNAIGGKWNAAWDAGNNIHLSDTNNSDLGPRFVGVDSATLNLRPDCGSRLIDAGDDNVGLTDATDLEALPRWRNNRIDIGAYESTRGPIPTKPIYNGVTTTCQGEPLVLNVDNDVANTEIYWTRAGSDINISMNRNPVTVSAALPGGQIVFQAVRVDVNTLCQSKPTDVPVTIYTSPKVVLRGDSPVCSGNNVEMSFIPVEGVSGYNLYRDGVLRTNLSGGESTVTDGGLTAGKYVYQLTATIQHADRTCESLKSDSLKIEVLKKPMLVNGSIDPVVSGDVVRHLPQGNVEGIKFTWSRAKVNGISNAAATGSDSINEVLINTTDNRDITVSYVYQMNLNGCMGTPRTVNVLVKPGIGVPKILRAYGDCGGNKIFFELKPAEGRKPSDYNIYRMNGGIEELLGNTGGANSTFEIRVSDQLPHQYKIEAVNGSYRSGKTPAVSVSAHPKNLTTVLAENNQYCIGNDIKLLSDNTNNTSYKIMKSGSSVGLDSNAYRVNGREIVVYAPPVGSYSYNVYAIRKYEDGAECESLSSINEIKIMSANRTIVADGLKEVNSRETTNITLHYESGTPATEFVWEVVKDVAGVTVASGEKKGTTMVMTLVNNTNMPQVVVFRVRDITGGSGCAPTLDVSITVNPLFSLSLVSDPGTDRQSICGGDAIKKIIYEMTGGISGIQVIGLPAGLTHAVTGARLTISGSSTVVGTHAYTVSLGGIRMSGTVTVKPTPKFKLGKRR